MLNQEVNARHWSGGSSVPSIVFGSACQSKGDYAVINRDRPAGTHHGLTTDKSYCGLILSNLQAQTSTSRSQIEAGMKTKALET
jgi:hypothetical protein